MQEPDLLSFAQTTQPPATEGAGGQSAGRLLRQAREAEHMHLETLAANLKVPVKKIQALENDDWAALPDMAFVRALAGSICRQLKISPEPILALLPLVQQHAPEPPARLAEDRALNAAQHKQSLAYVRRKFPWIWLVLSILLLGLAAWALNLSNFQVPWQLGTGSAEHAEESNQAHTGEWRALESDAAAESVTPASSVAADAGLLSSPMPVVTLSPVSPAAIQASAAALSASPMHTPIAEPTAPAAHTMTPAPAVSPTAAVQASVGVLDIQAVAESWMQVKDAQGKVLLSHSLKSGEQVRLPATSTAQLPYRLWVGRAEGVRLFWQGQAILAWASKTGPQRLVWPVPAAKTPPAGP